MACLHLAAKMEESPKQIKEITKVRAHRRLLLEFMKRLSFLQNNTRPSECILQHCHLYVLDSTNS